MTNLILGFVIGFVICFVIVATSLRDAIDLHSKYRDCNNDIECLCKVIKMENESK